MTDEISLNKPCCTERVVEGRKIKERGELVVITPSSKKSRGDAEVHTVHTFPYFNSQTRGLQVKKAYRVTYTCLNCGQYIRQIKITGEVQGFIQDDGRVFGEELQRG